MLSGLQVVAAVGGVSLRGSTNKGALSPTAKAMVYETLAFQPAKRGEGVHRKHQARAACLVSHYLDREQMRWFVDQFEASRRSQQRSAVSQRVHVYTHQWDETTQRLRQFANRFSGGASFGQQRVEIIVQHGGVWCFAWEDDELLSKSHAPFFIRPKVVENLKADSILHALLVSMPVPLLQTRKIAQQAATCDLLILSWAFDRASSNISGVQWFLKYIENEKATPLHVVAHGEPCNAHGASLVKGRVRTSTVIAAALISFSKLLRQGSFTDALREVVARLIDERLRVRPERRPVQQQERGQDLIAELYGGGRQ